MLRHFDIHRILLILSRFTFIYLTSSMGAHIPKGFLDYKF